MVNRQKVKGTNWERELVKLIEDNIPRSKAKRIAGSGAIGTTLNEPLLCGDLIVYFPGFSKKFRIEAKTGYGGSKQLTIKKEWLDKIGEEAKNTYSIPALAGKFLDARSGVKHFIVLDFSTFCGIINTTNELKNELDLLYEKLANVDND